MAVRRSRPAAPLSLTRCWARSFDQDSARQGIRRVFEFLRAHDLLTGAGVREWQQWGCQGPPSLLSAHVRSCAAAFLDETGAGLLGMARDELQDRWTTYRERHDLNKKVRPTPYQAVLLAYSQDRSVDGLMRKLFSFPDLASRVREVLDSAPPADRTLLSLLLYLAEQPDLVTAVRSVDPSARALQVLPHLKAGELHLVAVLALRRRIGREEDHPLRADLARAVNLPRGIRDRARAALSPPELASLARPAERLYSGGEPLLALAALRTVGDEDSLLLLEREPPAPGCVRFGGRPGTCLARALWDEARLALGRYGSGARRQEPKGR
ncbi:MAG: hypothetical protein HY319_02730 [Armatimonadetes bacterium]|nr:hypothetical protein [Armatimonadota bacterium]